VRLIEDESGREWPAAGQNWRSGRVRVGTARPRVRW
jgi:hypothetical protein